MSLIKKAKNFVADNVKSNFHDKRLAKIEALKLKTLLSKKNPYLFRAKAVVSAPQMVEQILDAYLSSQEESIFGTFLESLAIFICSEVYSGVKPASINLDLDFSRDGQRYLVCIKSGPNWGNSSQISQMVADFKRARKIIGVKPHVQMVNGCCYGKDSRPYKTNGDYIKLCGQDFWFLISNDASMYHEIVEPLGHLAKQRNDEFAESYGRVITLFTKQFTEEFCTLEGAIDWPRIVDLASQSKTLWQP
jgi:Type II restriction endonuclease EcoO109I